MIRNENGVVVDARTCIVALSTNVVRRIDLRPGLDPAKQQALTEKHGDLSSTLRQAQRNSRATSSEVSSSVSVAVVMGVLPGLRACPHAGFVRCPHDENETFTAGLGP